ncbi:MAG: hypothetical protein AAGI44_03095 [Pseudomonadota bacterium]
MLLRTTLLLFTLASILPMATYAEEINYHCQVGNCGKNFPIGEDEEKIIHTYCENGANAQQKVECTPVWDKYDGDGCKAPVFVESGSYWDCQCHGHTDPTLVSVNIYDCP